MHKIILAVALAASALMAQNPMEGHAPGERFFHKAGIAVRLVGSDSVLVTIGARSEDLQNTVDVFPYYDELSTHRDTATFRLFERKLEAYYQQRVPVRVNGKNLYLTVVQWKPGGKGRGDGLDMSSLFVEDLFVTLGARLPAKRTTLDVTANMWVERRDAAQTIVQFSFFEDRQLLRRLWTRREKRVSFPLHADSIKVMKANPPSRMHIPSDEEDLDEEDEDHTGHSH